jgi:hypothetical protein
MITFHTLLSSVFCIRVALDRVKVTPHWLCSEVAYIQAFSISGLNSFQNKMIVYYLFFFVEQVSSGFQYTCTPSVWIIEIFDRCQSLVMFLKCAIGPSQHCHVDASNVWFYKLDKLFLNLFLIVVEINSELSRFLRRLLKP